MTDILKKHCGYDGKVKQRRGKKITPGKAVGLDDLADPGEGRSDARAGPSGKKGARKRKHAIIASSSESSSEEEEQLFSDNDEAPEIDDHRDAGRSQLTYKKDQWVLVSYPGKKKDTTVNYIGKICAVTTR